MNALRAIPKPLANAKYLPKTLNLYKTTIRDPSKNGEIKELGWEDPSVRIANTVTWLLQNAKRQGLTMRNDGFVCVQELLQHPRVATLDFSAIERAVHSFRSHQLKLIHAPRSMSGGASSSQVSCWWIGLQPNTHEQYADQRVINPDEVPDLVYKASQNDWPTLQTRGISRGTASSIAFGTRTVLPLDYQGDHTFIRLNTNKILTQSDIKLYRSCTINPKRGNKLTEVITSPASNIPPSMFQSAMRVAIERYPLILRETPDVAEGKKKGMKGKGKVAESPKKAVVVQAGIDALRNFGYGHVLDSSSLVPMLKAQEEEREREREREKVSAVLKKEERLREKVKKGPSRSRSTSSTQQ